jgi:NAD(P)-dependent dehydrogenase (short-subunit alcohol dehydrogenase family)
MIDLADKVAVVTGAASGIGRASALRLAEAGAAVMCADIDGAGAKATSDEITGAGGRAESLSLDVTDETAVERCLHDSLDALGGLDILFNNAGVGGGDYERTLDVNLNGVYHGLKHGAALLASRGGGAIVNTASIAGLVGLSSPIERPAEDDARAGSVAYIASKHAVVGMTRQFALQYASQNVRVNAVAPGYIATSMTEMMWEHAPTRAQYEALHPMGRLGQADEIATTVVFLASDAASFITGATLPVDGGYTAR